MTNQPEKPDKAPGTGKGFNGRILGILIALVVMFIIISSLASPMKKGKEIGLDEFMESVRATHHDVKRTDKNIPTIAKIEIKSDDELIVGEYNDPVPEKTGKYFRVRIPRNFAETSFMDEINEYNRDAVKPIKIAFKARNPWVDILVNIIPWLLLFGFFWFVILRQFRSSGGPGGVLSFGKSRATLISKERPKTTFRDVAGIDEARDEIREIVEFLKDPRRFQRLGGRIPKGVLLIGPPGTGKTLLARAIAGEADVPFFSISGSDFVEMFVGVGASRVRDLFHQAKENAPSIIFLDEIDAVGRRRGSGMGGGHDEREQTLNAILVEMDGFESDNKIIVIAATNRQDVLDPALLRPGRFDRHIDVDLPDIKGREAILRVHAAKIVLGDDINLKTVAKTTPGFSGADLENLINEAALVAVMNDHDAVTMEDMESARDKVQFGRAKTSRVIDPEEKKITAYHEAGHALTAYYNPLADNPHKITVIPHGQTAGLTSFLPDKERNHLTRKRLLANLEVYYGGRVAEELFCDDISAGASSDIQRATEIARRMVISWGMSEKLGPLHYGENTQTLFLGRELTRSHDHSDETNKLIDQEISRIINRAYMRAKQCLKEHENEIRLLAQGLIERETIVFDEMEYLLKEGRLPSKAGSNEAPSDDASADSNDAPGAVVEDDALVVRDVFGEENVSPVESDESDESESSGDVDMKSGPENGDDGDGVERGQDNAT